MWKTIRNVVIGILAVLGVLFIIVLLLPDDEEEEDTDTQQVEIVSEEQAEVDSSGSPEDSLADLIIQHADDEAGEGFAQTTAADDSPEQTEVSTDPAPAPDTASDTAPASGAADAASDTVTVNIPDSALSANTIKFKTVSLDDKQVTQDIFSGYDLTIVHVWGTYCQPCISEMGDYAQLYKELPGNVNLIAIVCDVYDGIDNNVSSANRILSDAGAEFTNLRTSDDVYNIISGLQYIPSSFFVDSEGHLIGEMLNGASYSETVAKLNGYLK